MIFIYKIHIIQYSSKNISDVKERKPQSYLSVRLNQDIHPSLYGVAHRLPEVNVPVAEEPFHKSLVLDCSSGRGLRVNKLLHPSHFLHFAWVSFVIKSPFPSPSFIRFCKNY